ncbi:hypothetical protein [robinz microvirus RP_93]|nr:hypothetical protein [robinz microvirus RP_93]
MRAVRPAGIFLMLLICNMCCYFDTGFIAFTFSAKFDISFDICLCISTNCGFVLVFAARALLLCAMSSASSSIWISFCVNMFFVLLRYCTRSVYQVLSTLYSFYLFY